MQTAKLYTTSIIRHLLSGIVGWLVAKDFITGEQGESIIAAIALAVITLAWSLISKYLLNRKIDTALDLPAGASREQLEDRLIR